MENRDLPVKNPRFKEEEVEVERRLSTGQKGKPLPKDWIILPDSEESTQIWKAQWVRKIPRPITDLLMDWV